MTCLSLALMAAPVTAAPAEEPKRSPLVEDNQLWYDGQVTWGITRQVEMIGSGGARLGRGCNHWTHERAGVAVAINLFPFLKVAPSYFYIASQPVAGKDTRERRIGIEGTLHWQLHGFDLSDRNRVERRVLPTQSYMRYMNRVQVEHPLKLGNQRVNLMVSDEAFYDGALAAWSRNRFAVGIEKRLSKAITLEFYYLRQDDHYVTFGKVNAFGVSFRSAVHRLGQ